MKKNASRRHFLKTSSVVAATSLLGTSLSACGGSSGPSPLTTEQQLALTATQAVAAIRAGSMTAVAYTTTLLARAKALSDLNGMIALNESGALAAAAKVDADRAAGKTLPALAGLPIVVKDNINTKELKTTGGTPALKNLQPSANAPSLQKLIDAGAIVLGKANLHELAFGATSTNFTLGTANGEATQPAKNPYDKTRIPGGSSGGTAVAIAARFATAGLGTDTGGSTRVPAALCGIAGFRPSVGDGVGKGRRYVDTNAVIPISRTRDTVGPMARTVADVALLDAVITGSTAPAAKALKGLRMGVPASFWAGLDTSLSAVVNAAKTKLTDAGVVMVDVDISGLMAKNDSVSFQVALHEPIADIPAYLAANGASSITLQNINDQLASPDVKGAFGAIMADAFGGAYADAINTHRPAMQKMYADYFSANKLDCILFPTTILPAPTIDAKNGSADSISINGEAVAGKSEFTALIRNTDPGSNAGLPGLSIPAGTTASGLPVGLEIDGPLGSDQTLLAIGLSIEALLGSIAAPKL